MTIRLSAAAAAVFVLAPFAAAQETPSIPVPALSPEAPAAMELQSGTLAPPAFPQDTGHLAADAEPAASSTAAAPEGELPALKIQQTAEAEGSRTDSPAAVLLPPADPVTRREELAQMAGNASEKAMKFLRDGGPSIWAIAALSVATMALILWKTWRLALIGAWSRGKAGRAVTAFERGDEGAALAIVQGRRGIRSAVVATALTSVASMPEPRAREETARVAKLHLASAGAGLGALELIATIAPLLGLLGTVLGMIAAFQALQAAGSKADPALLAGGIWEALLTTAAGMAVAIPASAALTWFEAVINRIRRDIEDNATRIFVANEPQPLKLAAE